MKLSLVFPHKFHWVRVVIKLIMGIEIEQQHHSVQLSNIAVSDTHGEDSPYFAGWKAYDENPYDEFTNPSGVIQMGLAENQVSN